MKNSDHHQWELGRRSLLRGAAAASGASAALLLPGCSANSESESAATSPSQTVRPVAAQADADVYELTCNQIPNHSTGVYPNASDPWPILPVERTWRFARYPEADPEQVAKLVPTPTISAANTGGVFGMAINGVRYHTNAPFWKTRPDLGWQFEQTGHDVGMYFGLDHNNAHTHPIDGYHYHALPWGLLDLLSKERSESGSCSPMLLMGWAADGYPIYAPFVDADYYFGAAEAGRVEIRSSYRLKTGARPQPSADDPDQPGGIYDGTFAQDYEYVEGLGDLDECNGRFAKTPEYPDGIYHYFLTRDFPGIPRFWRGTPNQSFILDPPAGQPIMLLPLMGPSMNWQPLSQTDLLGNPANAALFGDRSLPTQTSTRASLQSISIDGFCYLFMVSSSDNKVYLSARADSSDSWSPWALLPGQEYPALDNSQPVSLDFINDTLYVTQTVDLPVQAGPGPYPYQLPYGEPNHRIQTLIGQLKLGQWLHQGSALDFEP